ncbi:DUF3703 domain-containing protein [uncultured Phenylobacterium sp.]|uniref:DUF3703 domain-containing protein n=1 Tax=uncultured Phenylobacterium sp. TaxID=349273 RepID=UPI0025DD5FE5|nr:DUF3703 domain-containing protein [uncultured Phenylobacterium sp.]
MVAATVGFDRGRNFYPVLLVTIAGYYVLFAIEAGSIQVLALELWIVCGFVCIAVAGFRWNLWLIAAGLLGHGLLDLVHPHLLPKAGAPAWWPQFCLAFDPAAAACLSVRLLPPSARPVAAELEAAEFYERHGRWEEAFAHLERAHVLGQASTIEHVRVHVRMSVGPSAARPTRSPWATGSHRRRRDQDGNRARAAGQHWGIARERLPAHADPD